MSIPRIELMAAVTAVKMSSMITDAVEFVSPGHAVTEELFWTDSTTVLRYIQNRKTRFQTFVANRLAIIHDSTKPEQWRYVPSEQNPADDASRGVQGERWLVGPQFLTLGEEDWPKPPPAMDKLTDTDPEVKRAASCAIAASEDESTDRQDPMKTLVNYYSDKHSLLRGLAWLLRVRQRLVKKTRPTLSLLEAAELREAERLVIKWVQRSSFHQEYADLEKVRSVSRSNRISILCSVMVDGIMHVGGRLQNADVASEAKHPIILPSEGHFTEPVVQEAHERTGHCGRQQVLSKLRNENRFWIVRGSTCVRRVLRQCAVCCRHEPPESQKMADLPMDRVAFEPAFTHTGVECGLLWSFPCQAAQK